MLGHGERKPSIPLKHVCVMVQRLLAEPNPESPLNTDAARMLSNDPEMYDRTVLMWVKTHAQGVYSYPPFDQKLEDLSMKCGDIEQALQLLTNTYWVYDDAEHAKGKEQLGDRSCAIMKGKLSFCCMILQTTNLSHFRKHDELLQTIDTLI
ncbi:uncharacterized protein LOC117642392 [Thrips palmi]|uniref:Uncharacterized protein LOC117642392 n=1 Tax=Thrips palmi TaxID=161013 RepID=A0A6P8YIG2_THRPL|nr:uncharacterized protein LOC117642392 [Thrips palmi]